MSGSVNERGPKRMPRRSAAAMLGAIALVTLSACSAAPEATPFIVHEPNSDGGGMDALVEGTLTDEGECIGIHTSEGETYVISFPRGTGWTPPGTLTLGGTELRVGDRVSLGGGHLGTVAEYRASGADVPDSCPDDAIVWRAE